MQPEANRSMLEYQLKSIGKVSDAEFKKLKGTKKKKAESAEKIKVEVPKPKPKFRDDFPFLRDPDCPHELMILVGYKITAYHKYIDGHKKLFECTSLEDCTATAKQIIDNYQENRLIYEELEFYKEHKQCLGKHPIFKVRRKFENFKSMSQRMLYKLHDTTIPHRIWRIESEIKKGDKPHLDTERQQRIMECKAEMAEIARLLNIKPEEE